VSEEENLVSRPVKVEVVDEDGARIVELEADPEVDVVEVEIDPDASNVCNNCGEPIVWVDTEWEHEAGYVPCVLNDGKTNAEPKSNLKEDFVYFIARTGTSSMECTCGKFYESGPSTEAGVDRLAKKAVRHARRTGHTLKPRGN
jgi:hypothetical protein